ncbi:response regulator [Candidatus Binatia bacterium]|nr:response regulator [Candidatus Binatia bacterium]
MKRALIVDDKPENLYLLRALLEGHGCEVVEARHGAEALALARQTPLDMAITDLLMPVMDGYTLLRHWKADPKLKAIPLVVYTATYTDPQDEKLALDLGADGFILKPTEPDVFLADLERICARAERGQLSAAAPTVTEEPLVLREYSEALVRRLEDKSRQLEISNQELRDTEANLRAVFENAMDGILIAEVASRRFVFCNPMICRMLGYTRDELLTLDVSRIHPPEDLPRVASEFEKQVRQEHILAADLPVLRKDGSVFHADINSFPIAFGGQACLAGFFRDITERKRAEMEVQELNAELERRVAARTAQLEAANRELEAFSYSVSHDLRAPLRHIEGFSRTLLEDYTGALDAQGRHYLERVGAAAQRMMHLIDGLIELSRVARTEIRALPVDLSAMAQAIAAELQRGEPGRAVQFVIAPGLVVSGDARLLYQVMENLLGNAWKYTSKHTTARIEFGAQTVASSEVGVSGGEGAVAGTSREKPGTEKVYFVRDDGAGFKMQYVDRLFVPFQRLHSAGEHEGTGIGLATVARIVHCHGGRIWAEGAVEQGATFYFTIETQPC